MMSLLSGAFINMPWLLLIFVALFQKKIRRKKNGIYFEVLIYVSYLMVMYFFYNNFNKADLFFSILLLIMLFLNLLFYLSSSSHDKFND
ncbi:hypothetical protein [Acinetobacter venetianus]|uniref:Uncharacterized protein n=1 Tax=Acinetobacter venetianus TaxID=52133 RepID=A0A150HRC8_9GAMM|nr:hypothetical protein [Acinetobacter venetianus]KXZ69131.1 hypothetical protein AVENLUH13518_02667 [Acinetobacter venetianus]